MSPGRATVEVVLPYHLRTLAHLDGGVSVDAGDTPTLASVLDALEATHPELQGTIRDPATGRRRPFVRFFACGDDISHQSLDTALPAAVARGDQPLLVVGAMAGG